VREWRIVDGTVAGVSQLALYEYIPAPGTQHYGVIRTDELDRFATGAWVLVCLALCLALCLACGMVMEIYINSSPSSLPASTSTTLQPLYVFLVFPR
jgi:hypothetical protein